MKSKPVKGSARTKRFDIGGTVGALAGLGTLAYLMSRKKKGAATGNEGSGESTAKPIIKSMMDTEDSAAKQRAMAASKGRPEMGDATNDDITTKKTTTPVVKKTTPSVKATSPAPKKTTASDTSGEVKPPMTATSKLKSSPVIEAGKKVPQSKTAPITGKSNEERESKSYPAVAAEKKKADAERRKGQGMTPYAPSRAEEIRRKERFHKEAALGRGIKNGGAVKKYADGGMTSSKPEPKKAPMPAFAREAKENRERDQKVKKEQDTYQKGEKTRLKDQGSMFKSGGMTASKRADGIAMRGKTRGKMY
jgi:hypothetical protein